MNNRIKFAIVAAGALGLLPMSPARADTLMDFNICEGGTCQDFTSTTRSVTVPTTMVGDYSVSGFANSSQPPLGGTALFGSNTLDVTTNTVAANDLIIKVTAFELTDPANVAASFMSSFGQNGLNLNVVSKGQTFIDPADAGGLVDAISPLVTFSNIDTTVGGSADTSGGPFSLTAVYDIHPTNANSEASLNIAVAVPGPVIGAGLPGLLAACGGLIALARRRRRTL